MKNRIYIFLAALMAFATCAAAQGQTAGITRPSSDSTSIPSLAELKAQVLNPQAKSGQTSLIVPGEHRAFFCRFDDKLDKKHIPLRMRLGSVEEVNRMESKPGYRVGQAPL